MTYPSFNVSTLKCLVSINWTLGTSRLCAYILHLMWRNFEEMKNSFIQNKLIQYPAKPLESLQDQIITRQIEFRGEMKLWLKVTICRVRPQLPIDVTEIKGQGMGMLHVSTPLL